MTGQGSGWELFEQLVQDQLHALRQQSRYRQLTPQGPEIESPLIAGHIDLTHNDYLGLRVNSTFRKRAQEAVTYLPPGAGASRLLGGEHPIFQQLEAAFSQFKQAPSSLYFTSGYAANEAVAACLALPDAAVFSDQLNHASIIDGLRLAKLPKERRIVYAHLDLNDLETRLSTCPAKLKFVYTESVFSMDGDIAPLTELQRLCNKHAATLVVDEAHGIGVRGAQGCGEIAGTGLSHDRIISINTCGKALGAQGALVCGPTWFRELMINKARSFIYTTAPSPWMAAALLESLAIVAEMDQQRTDLQTHADNLRVALRAQDLDLGQSQSHIIPIVLGSEDKALAVQAHLEQNGILAKAIRPPTVPEGKCRVRLSLNTLLSPAHYEKIAKQLREALDAN